jgi:hypothetical protein
MGRLAPHRRRLLVPLALASLLLLPAAADAQPSSTPSKAAKAAKAAKAGQRGKGAKAECRRDRDEIVPLKYPDAGQVWIPREVGCGGRAEVVILLHGNQGNPSAAPSVGGGRHLERLARQLLSSGNIRPVILAEPVHYSSCGGGKDLFGGSTSFVEYRKRLFRLLGARKIRPASMAVIGHSGAGCCPNSGVFKAAEQLGRLKVLATSDTCYHSQIYAKRLHEVLKPGTVYMNVSRGEPAYDRYKTFETEMLGKKPVPFRLCRKELYRRCVKHPGRPWFSYTTKRTDVGYHDAIPFLVLRNALLRHYGPAKKPKVQAAEDHPPAPPPPPPDFVGPPAPPDQP